MAIYVIMLYMCKGSFPLSSYLTGYITHTSTSIHTTTTNRQVEEEVVRTYNCPNPSLKAKQLLQTQHQQQQQQEDMSLYYSLVFAILVTEIILFAILALPIPSKFRKPLTLILLKPFKIPPIQIALKCILSFILLLFIDSINKVININKELSTTSSNSNPTPAISSSNDRIEILSRKFFAQRNMYLTGITLFLTFIVMRTFTLVNELLDLKDRYRIIENRIGGKGSKLSKEEQIEIDEKINYKN
ncbi:Yet3p NDAI_0D04330 [Naumovozyma dairenensis CBS 421]|uniref:Endoplasmic reticulum transmembrane protein n=1 Tax=Naumovozyma dairenensis (strain ATCC 10597 / BCRC 20456 / CBS 421 / NBRC 0211 / NRRL Y-12639) TaxID=1071378 RepID=G0WAD6_NAUDC|nr:hypothetical protein NDAI_0D04330 [Naumovozyma dairenensis CBS 421]CCD24747.1 hypothetical protein NDAI_0D04330 [Naumovozyma dairenensis CBS 421]